MNFSTARFVAFAFVLLLLDITAFAQNRARIVMSPGCYDTEDQVLLELAAPRLAGVEVPFDKSFAAGDEWLAQLVFRVTNKGKKPIAAIVITAGLLGGVDEQLGPGASYDYGLQFIRKHSARAKPGAKLRAIVGPEQTVEITAEGSRPYGLRYLDAILGGTTKANNWAEFASKVGARFQRLEIMRADIWFTDGSSADASLVVKGKCDEQQ